MTSFSEQIAAFSAKVKKNEQEVVAAILFKAIELVVSRTPVITGQARGGWLASIGSIPTGTGSKDKDGGSTISRAQSIALGAAGKVFYLANNVGHTPVLEYGGYPDPPEKGSWNKKEKKFEILSKGGYSKQAPAGMVRISLAELEAEIEKVISSGR